jgi:tetratricopeptide (TPR) repeat protein
LAYAHQRGVIHRDIKPGNIMVLQDGVNDGMAVIVDFGIARIGGDTRLTKTDQIVGSVHYMSSEQLQAKELDSRTDIYATGVVLFQLLTGALPFDSPDTAATLLKIVNEPPPPLSTYIKDYPPELDGIVNHALAKKRDERYASAKDLAFDLMQVQDHLKSETVAQLFERAEVSLRREEWTRAREHLQQVLRLDRQNTTAQKLMNGVQERLRQLQQIEQARAFRSQADEAYLDQRYDDALRLLEQAVALDGSNSDLVAFRDLVRSAKERATGLRRALRRAEAALQDGDLDEAQNAVSEAFKLDPQDTQAKALKMVIAQQAEEKLRHEKVRKLLDEARNLIAARHLTAAFNILKSAEALDPTSNELQTVAKLAVAAREQEKRRAETDALRQQIEAALREEDYGTAVARAEEGLLKFPHEQSLLKLKALADAQRLRVEQKKFVREQYSAANSLADAGQVRQAVALLESALQRAPGNTELESLRVTFLDRLATEDAGQLRQQEVETALAEGDRILQERGASEATQFFADRAAAFSDSPQFRERYDYVREREALEALDRRLTDEPNPARQIQLAEETLRYNPNNRWIQQRVTGLHQLRDQINAVIKRAQGFEATGRFPEAMQQWQQLSKSYPQVPEFDEQVRRIASFLENRNKTAAAVVEPRKQDKTASSFSATRVLDSAVLPSVEPSKAATVSGPVTPPVVPQPKKIQPAPERIAPPRKPTPPPDWTNLLTGPRKYLALAAAVMVVIVVGYLIFGGGKKTVTVRIDTNPAGANVTVGTQKCTAPCELSLLPGTYDVRVEKDGYETVSRQLPIAADTKSLPIIELVQTQPPKPLTPPVVEQGTLMVRSNVDDAEVLVDGDQKGVTKHNKYEGKFDVGSHQIILRKSKYKDSPSQSIEIAKGRQGIKIFLEKGESEVGYIVITTNAGATVAVDGKVVEGRVPREGRRTQPVTPGRHSIQIELDGYDHYNGQADVKLGENFPIYASLKPKLPTPTPQPQTAPPTIVFFTPTPSSVQQGQSVQLNWKTENADVLTIDPIGSVEGSSKEVSPTKTTRYTLIARGPGGTTRSESVTVTVNAPPPPPPAAKPASIDAFEPGQDAIQPGQSTKLFWRTQNANVSIDQGIGPVDVSGIWPVSPSRTTTYTLTARGQGGDEKKQSVTVKVVEVKVAEQNNQGGDMQCIENYKTAYQLKDINELVKAWPALGSDTKRKNALKDSFRQAQAIVLRDQCAAPSVSGDIAHYQCNETMIYTSEGRAQKPQTSAVEFVCRKTPTGWVVENHIVK